MSPRRAAAAAGPFVVEQRAVGLRVERIEGTVRSPRKDVLAAEEPLEIRIGHGHARARQRQSLTVTMRTPGNDVELAVGFLFAEGVVGRIEDIEHVESCGPPVGPLGVRNIVRVELVPRVKVDAKLRRSFLTTSSCGLCGKASLAALPHVPSLPKGEGFTVAATAIHALPGALVRAQRVFEYTGGLHAAALFDCTGSLLDVREDIGRHNALDKLIGARVLAAAMPLSQCIVLVSGRAGYELVQKSVAAGAPVLAAVGAPSSLAADLAREANLTLLGFVRDGRFNVYSGGHRIRGTVQSDAAAATAPRDAPS